MEITLTQQDLGSLSDSSRREIITVILGPEPSTGLETEKDMIVMSASQAREFVKTLGEPTLRRLYALVFNEDQVRMLDVAKSLPKEDIPGETFMWDKVMSGLSRRFRKMFGDVQEQWIVWRQENDLEEIYPYASYSFRIHPTTRKNLLSALEDKGIRP